MDLALIGLPLSGKTTVFQALAGAPAMPTAKQAQREGPGREHIAVVPLPDQRLDRLAALFQAKKVTYAEGRLHDLPAPTGRGGAGLSGDIAALAPTDALVHVVRAFHRDDVPHPEGSVDPHRDIEALNLELAYHDLAIAERRLEKLDTAVRSARPGEREAGQREQLLLMRARQHLADDLPLRGQIASPDDIKPLASYGLLTLKPLLLLLNIDEADCPNASTIEADLRGRYGGPKTAVLALCAKLEAELAELPGEDAAAFRRELGAAADGAAQRLQAAAYELLALVTFYTVVGEECRAWPVPAGTTALGAAAKVHTDMERGFIRAEVIQWDKLLELGSLAEARKRGVLRTEGKQYVVQDGDVLHILFHV